MRSPSREKQRARRRQGLSLLEVVISTFLVGMMVIGAMRCLGGSIRARMATANSVYARQLAQQLMTEIVNEDYEDAASPTFGPEPGEAIGNRSLFDDVDDYHSWIHSPPRRRNGGPIPGSGGWQREVTVELVDPTDPGTDSGVDQGVKRITVVVRRNGADLCQLVSLRSDRYVLP